MSYQHDVFISYRRELQWTPWTRDYLKRALASYLQQDLGRPPDIFVDERIDIGDDWVDALGTHLAQSRVVVAILSRDYFSSIWCLHEMDLILNRFGGRVGLFASLIVHDCDVLPDPISRAQKTDFKAHRVARMNEHGQAFEDFNRAVGLVSPQIARLIDTAPIFDPAWVIACVNRFREVYEANGRGDKLDPLHFDPRLKPPYSILPRLVP